MKSFIVAAAALLLVTGCSSKNLTAKQVTPEQSKVETHNGYSNRASTIKQQASSISTQDGAKSVTIKEAPVDNSNLMDWLNRTIQDPSANPQTSVYPNPSANPQPTNNPNPSANPQPSVNPNPSAYPQQPSNPNTRANPQPSGNLQPSADSSQYAQQVLDLVNQERSKAGLNAVSMNSELSKVAMAKAQDMYNNNYFDHQSPTYGSPFDMMKSYGISYSTAGENIANGQSSPTEVMDQWMNSPGHRANILNTSYTQIGIAYYNGEWVQEFIG
ncbi:CAP domain-containing protein [Paenibacillus filicis]|uniref:CAP domain-containing protein n=1 Tax=Paenibacillus filicis TaxID=669464 RepID=A0ABU9DCX8_9BACL